MKKMFSAVVATALMVAGSAHAALDTASAAAIDSGIADVTSTMNEVFAKALPLILIGIGLIAAVKYTKRFLNKA